MSTQDDCSIVLMARGGTQDALTNDELADLLDLPEHPVQRARQISRYRQILSLAADPISLKAISLAIHVKPKYAKRYVRRLLAMDLLSPIGGCFAADAG